MRFFWTAFLVVLAVALAEARVHQRRGLTFSEDSNVVGGHPYLFLNVPRGHSGSVIKGFEVIEENDDDRFNDEDSSEAVDDDDGDDDDDEVRDDEQRGSIRAAMEVDDSDDDDDNENEDESDETDNAMQTMSNKKTTANASNLQMLLQNVKPTQMMVSKEHAGAIMVPDGIIEIEGQSVIDEKTGKHALLVPREALDAIPDGSVVALMERSAGALTAEEEEERANRVIVRRRRRGSRRNVRRRVNGNQKRRRRVNGNRNRRRQVNNRRKNVRVVRPNRNNRRRVNNRRGGNRRGGNRPIVYQG